MVYNLWSNAGFSMLMKIYEVYRANGFDFKIRNSHSANIIKQNIVYTNALMTQLHNITSCIVITCTAGIKFHKIYYAQEHAIQSFWQLLHKILVKKKKKHISVLFNPAQIPCRTFLYAHL